MTETKLNVIDGSSLWALLIGIDEYQKHNRLYGCVNDVEAMKSFLINQLDVPEEQILTLKNQEGYRANILKTFQEFLINNSKIEKGNQILFHFSGHGTQIPDPQGIKLNGLREAIVPYDSRTLDQTTNERIFDIPDDTLAALMDKLAVRKGNNITVILDSCHSGSGTRDPNLVQTRSVPTDTYIPPTDLDLNILAGTSQRGAGASGWSVEGISHVLLAGCRDREESHEYQVFNQENKLEYYGALTYFTLQALRQIANQTTTNMTYAELHERVATQVNTEFSTQMPQCEGDRDRIIFGGIRIQRDPFITVQKVEGSTVTLGAGLIHGLHPETELALYPPEVRTKDNLPKSLTTVKVTSVSATIAEATIKEGMPIVAIPDHARGLVTKPAYGGLSQTLALEADEDEGSQTAIIRLRQLTLSSRYLKEQAIPNQVADLRVKAVRGQLSIYDSAGELLVAPEGMRNESQVFNALESIVRYRTLQKLVNEDPNSELVGKVKLRLLHYIEGQTKELSKTEELSKEEIGTGGEITLTFDPRDEKNNKYVLEVENQSSQEIYAHLFILNPDYSIKYQYPQHGQEEAIEPQHKLTIGFDNGEERLKIDLPPNWDSCRDHLKVIVTTKPTDLQLIEQNGLKVERSQRDVQSYSSPLKQLFDTVLSGNRFVTSDADETVLEDWATTELLFNVVRESKTKSLLADDTHIELSDGLTLVKPANFQGQVSVTTLGQGTRNAQSNFGLQPPPGLEQFPDLFKPIEYPSRRGLGSSALVITLEIDEASRQIITPENPLRLELSTLTEEEVTDVLPIAFDGEDYLLVGYGTDEMKSVDIVALPQVVQPQTQGITTRGIGHTIRLFLYKKMGRYTSQIGLRSVKVVDNEVIYSPTQNQQFKPGDRVALFVHGFNADTKGIVKMLAPFLEQNVLLYDHLLTWDYETFGTSVEESGSKLAQALVQQCGLNSDDEITLHVYAHSMGSLVSRCMVELSGGHEFVDRLVMAGPPNYGTTLATVSRGLVYLITALINQVSIIPPIAASNWLLEQLYQQGVGLADLATNSPIVEKLNALEQPSNVPYLVLAGENYSDLKEHNRLNRLAHKVIDQTLDHLFGEQNDAVVGISSMQNVRGGSYSLLTVETLNCDHFNYFIFPQSLAAIQRWIGGEI